MTITTNLTIFGGTGDLTFRKLLPALYAMYLTQKLPQGSRIVIIGRREYDSAAYRSLAKDWIRQFTHLPFEEKDFAEFAEHIAYFRMDLSDPEAYLALDDYFAPDNIESHLFYFAVAPGFFSVITQGLRRVRGGCKGKVLLEKPFGETLETAEKLNEELEDYFGAEQIYRIDHYLGKEMVRNIRAIRSANPIFANVWNSKYIDYVQISALEEVGVETRGGYYDASGALKDMVQNHLLQILSIVAMEERPGMDSDEMHTEQVRVLQALHPVSVADIQKTLTLGQYRGYREESKVAPDSNTETFAALCLYLDNPRWEGTPFYIRTGKRTGVRETEVSIVFRPSAPDVEPDLLVIKIQPTEGIHLQFNIKRPGEGDDIIPVKMDFCQSCDFRLRSNTPEAYERLITACMEGDRSWFSQWDQIALGWRYVERLKELSKRVGLRVYPYAQGAHGPQEAQFLLEQQGHQWMAL